MCADVDGGEIALFDRLAGAAYSVTGLLSLASHTSTFADAQRIDKALAAWLLIAESVAKVIPE